MRLALALVALALVALLPTPAAGARRAPVAAPVAAGAGEGESPSADGATYEWRNVAIGGGGYITGLVPAPRASHPRRLLARTDVGGIYALDVPLRGGGGVGPAFAQLTSPSVTPSEGDARLRTASVAVAAGSERVFLAAVGSSGSAPGGLLSSRDGGTTWAFTHAPFAVDGNDHQRKRGERLVFADADGHVALYGSASQGLWKSANGGMNWTRLDGLPKGDPPGVVWVAVGTATAAAESAVASGTAGASPHVFKGNNNNNNNNIHAAEGRAGGHDSTLAEGTPSLFAAVWGRGVYTSFDGGDTWSLLGGGEAADQKKEEEESLSPRFACRYAWMNEASKNQLVVTTNSTVVACDLSAPKPSWVDITPVADAPYCAVAATPATAATPPTLAVAGASGSFKETLHVSIDGGATWSTDLTKVSTWAADVPWWPTSWFASSASALHVRADADSVGAAIATWYGVWFTDDLLADAPAWYTRELGHEECVNLDLAVPPPSAAGQPPRSRAAAAASPSVLLYSGHADVGGFRHTSVDAASFPLAVDKFAGTQSTASIDVCEADGGTLARVGGNEPGDNKGCGQGFMSSDSGLSWSKMGGYKGACGGGVVFAPLPPLQQKSASSLIGSSCSRLIWTPYDMAPLYSSDGGASWSPSVGAPAGASGTIKVWEGGHRHRIAVDRAVTASDGGGLVPPRSFLFNASLGLFASSDAGQSWALINGTGGGSETAHVQVDPLVLGRACVCQMDAGLRCLDNQSILQSVPSVASCRLLSFGAPDGNGAEEGEEESHSIISDGGGGRDRGGAAATSSLSTLYVFGTLRNATAETFETVYALPSAIGAGASLFASRASDWVRIGSPSFRMGGASNGKMVADRVVPGRVFVGASGGQGVYIGERKKIGKTTPHTGAPAPAATRMRPR